MRAEFIHHYTNTYLSVSIDQRLRAALIKAEKDYIPIDYFKEAFNLIADLPPDFVLHHLIFDKQNLRTFHQPSMEWYFVIWKQRVKQRGLNSHLKILPRLEWFAKAVEAGRADIFKKHGPDIVKGLSIVYTDSVDSAVQSLTAEMK